MATVIRYVNTASTAGGDGTTNATTGANRAYASLAEWNTAEATDLVTAGDLHEVRCSGEGGPDTSTLTSWTGWTTGASNFILIKGNPADTTYGRNISRNFNSTNFRIHWSEPASTYKIYNPPRFTQWWDVQFHVTGPGFGVSFDEFIQINNSDSHYFYRCRFKNENIGWAATDAFISSENTSNNTQLHHCTFENTASASPTGRAVKASNGSIRAYNCVFTGWDIGLRYESVYTNVAQSCVFFDNDDDILVFSGSPTISYCASDDGDGTNSQDLSDDVDTDCADEAAQQKPCGLFHCHDFVVFALTFLNQLVL